MKKIIFFTIGLITLIGLSPNTVCAEVILSVTGNGEGTQNQVNIEAPTTTEVVQGNTMEENNNVENSAESGNNQANSNSSDASINTGSATSESSVANEDINKNVAVSNGCDGCPDISGTATISENGSGSYNTIDINQQNSISIEQSNTASITNGVESKAVSGENIADKNGGDVKIKTGNVLDSILILNRNINFDYALLTLDRGPFETIIFGNGENSTNKINHIKLEKYEYTSENVANIFNSVESIAQSGGNSAEENIGDVSIITGDVSNFIVIKNENINASLFTLSCCQPDVPIVPPVGPPSSPPTGGGESSSSSVSSPSVGGASIPQIQPAEILPVTGSIFLFLLLVGNLLTFFFGWYLRLRAGNSPGVTE